MTKIPRGFPNNLPGSRCIEWLYHGKVDSHRRSRTDTFISLNSIVRSVKESGLAASAGVAAGRRVEKIPHAIHQNADGGQRGGAALRHGFQRSLKSLPCPLGLESASYECSGVVHQRRVPGLARELALCSCDMTQRHVVLVKTAIEDQRVESRVSGGSESKRSEKRSAMDDRGSALADDPVAVELKLSMSNLGPFCPREDAFAYADARNDTEPRESGTEGWNGRHLCRLRPRPEAARS